MEGIGEKDIVRRTRSFAVSVVRFVNVFPRTPVGFEIGSQLVGCGTSVGANVEEAQDSISKKEFIKTINISLKEIRETIFWLKIIKETKSANSVSTDQLLKEAEELKAIIATIIRRTRQNQMKQ